MSAVLLEEFAEEVRAGAESERCGRAQRCGVAKIERAEVPESAEGSSCGSVDEVVRGLREELARHRDRWARRSGWVRRWVPTGLAPFDAVLPGGGVPSGATVEIRSDAPGVGAMSLALRIATAFAGGEVWGKREKRCTLVPDDVSLCGTHERSPPLDPPLARREAARPVVWVDATGELYPPAVGAYGLSLSRLIVVRIRDSRDALWAMEQALRCSAVGAVVGSVSRDDERDSRRLQLAAESSGGVGLVLRSGRRGVKSFAAVALHVEGVACADGSRRCRITVESVREGMPAGSVDVDLHDEAGDGAVFSVSGDRSVVRAG